MAGVWPNLDAADLEARVRTYLNEATADFYSQPEIWRWLSVAAKDIAQKTHCVQRVLDAQTAASTRTVAFNAYKVHHVEYIPTTGRPRMLGKITPLQTGHYPAKDTAPWFWYPFGATIGIDPLPAAIHELRLYVSDIPKMSILTFASFTEGAGATSWTDSGAGWACGATAAHTGTGPDTLTYNTTLAASTNHTLTFTVSGVGSGGSVTPYLGATAGVAVTTNGYHAQTITSPSGTPGLIFSAANTIAIDDLYVFKEADYAAVGDQTELPTMWQHLLALYATYGGLLKDKRKGPAKMLETIYGNEIEYLRRNVIEIIPDGRDDIKEK